MENEELYRLAQAGEADAFERLHKQLANFIRSIARAGTSDVQIPRPHHCWRISAPKAIWSCGNGFIAAVMMGMPGN